MSVWWRSSWERYSHHTNMAARRSLLVGQTKGKDKTLITSSLSLHVHVCMFVHCMNMFMLVCHSAFIRNDILTLIFDVWCSIIAFGCVTCTYVATCLPHVLIDITFVLYYLIRWCSCAQCRLIISCSYPSLSSSSFVSVKSFVPVHFYGQLVQHNEGCTLLKNEVSFVYLCEYICTCTCLSIN